MSEGKYQHKIERPSIDGGKIYSHTDIKVEKDKKGKEKIEYVKHFIDEEEWLNKQGWDRWELVCVLRNSMSYDIKEYYFKRELL